ncbi:hypothetical protein ACQCT5_02550 [Sutcliffiella halmapala]
MEIITWYHNELRGLENQNVKSLLEALTSNQMLDEIDTKEAITLCKAKLMGEYHGILIKEMQEVLEDAEIYLLIWDGEASDGGEMIRINEAVLAKIANESLFTER